MEFDHNDVENGISAGERRAEDHHLRFTPELGQDVLAKLETALRDWPTDLSGRFIQLFSELTVLAETARSYYEEDELKDDEVRAFLEVSSWFFNSFKHR